MAGRSDPELVHPVPAEEIPGWSACVAATFLNDPDSEDAVRWTEARRRDWIPERTWGARDHGRWVGTLQTQDRTITVPGRDGATELIGADALTAVTVAPTHRRRGLLTRMLDASLLAARDRGDVISILIAAEWGIYGRFGYAPAVWTTHRTLHRSRPGSAVAGDLTRVRHVGREEFATLAPAVFDLARRGRAGQVDRDGSWWDRAYGRGGSGPLTPVPHNHVVHDGPDGVDGLLAWSSTGRGGPWERGRVEAHGPLTASVQAHRDLWAYLSGLDGVDEVSVEGARDDPVRWLLPDARALFTTSVHDELWLRLLDVGAALRARRYAVDGELVLEVRDAGAVSVAGRYALGAHGEAVTCEPSSAAPDLVVAQTALASAYLGGVSLRGQRIAGRVEERTPGALALADAMLMTALAPLAWTGF